MDTEKRPSADQVELALMVARPGVRLGVKPCFVLAREVRHLRAELADSRQQSRLFADAGEAAELEIVKLRATVARIEACVASAEARPEARPEAWSFRDFVEWLRISLQSPA